MIKNLVNKFTRALIGESNINLHPTSGLSSILKKRYPSLNFEQTPDLLYSKRKEIGYLYASFFSDALTEFQRRYPERIAAVLDFNWDPSQRIQNIITPKINALCGEKYYDLLGDMHSVESVITEEEKNRHILDPFRLKTGNFLHIDHHYPDNSLSRTCTTSLVTDLILRCHKLGDKNALNKLKNAFVLMDHADSDIVLAHFVLKNADRPNFLYKHQHLLKATALYNDYSILSSTIPKQTLALFAILYKEQQDVEAGLKKMADTLAIVEPALEFATKYEEFSSGKSTTAVNTTAEHQVFMKCVQDFLAGQSKKNDILTGYTSAILDNPQTFNPGTCAVFGRMLCLYLKESDPDIEGSTFSEFMTTHCNDMQRDISILCIIRHNNGYQVKFRSVKDGYHQVMDLTTVYFGLKTKFPQRYPNVGGRPLAGSIAKSPVQSSDPEWVNTLIKDLLSVVTIVRENQSKAI